jgi:MFS family permease
VTRLFYGWVITASAFAVLFLTYGVQYSFGIFVPAMVAELGWPRASLGAAFSLYGVVYMCVTVISGRLTDTLGPRRVVTAGGLLLGAGIVATSQVTAQWQLFLSYGIVAALGMSTAYIPCNMTVVRWFRRKRGLAAGLASSGSSCGILTMPLVVFALISITDWRTAMLWCGAGLCLLTIIAASFFVTDPAAVGLTVDGDAHDSDAGARSRLPGAVAVPPGAPGWTLAAARGSVSLWLFVLGFAVALLTMTVPFVHLPGFAADLGLPELTGAGSVSMIGLFALLGGVSLGALADRIGHRRAMLVGLGAQVVAYAALYFADGIGLLMGGAAMFGVFYGSFVALFPALVADLYGLHHAGAIGGFIVGGGGLLGAWGPAAAGYLRDADGDFRRVFMFCVVTAVVALGLFVTLPRPRRPA